MQRICFLQDPFGERYFNYATNKRIQPHVVFFAFFQRTEKSIARLRFVCTKHNLIRGYPGYLFGNLKFSTCFQHKAPGNATAATKSALPDFHPKERIYPAASGTRSLKELKFIEKWRFLHHPRRGNRNKVTTFLFSLYMILEISALPLLLILSSKTD